MAGYRIPLTGWLVAIVLLHAAAATGLTLLLSRWVPSWSALALALLVLAPLAYGAVRWALMPAHALFRALAGTVASYRDGEYGFSLAWTGRGALRELVEAHNALGETLRQQRQSLVQRELLLDTMVQNTPVAMLLIDPLLLLLILVVLGVSIAVVGLLNLFPGGS